MSLRQELIDIHDFLERTDVIIAVIEKADQKAETYAANMGYIFSMTVYNRQVDVAQALLTAGRTNEVIAYHNELNKAALSCALENKCFLPKRVTGSIAVTDKASVPEFKSEIG